MNGVTWKGYEWPGCDLTPVWAGEFRDFNHWVNGASNRIDDNMVCVDTLGRRCLIGGDFMRARDEGTFPVRYFWEMRKC